MIRAFLLDDHEVVRAGLRELLQHDGDIKVATGNGVLGGHTPGCEGERHGHHGRQ